MTHSNTRAVLALLVAAWIGVFFAGADYSTAQSRKVVLGSGEHWSTAYYVNDRGKGPVVMVVAGLHGNEPAGSVAAERVKDYPIRRGTLIVIPRVNEYGLKKKVRGDRSGSDVNRDFPRTASERADTPLARAIWDVVRRYDPDWLMDLHEGYDYHVRNSASVGQSVIYDPNGTSIATAVKKIVAALNREAPANERFSIIKYPVKGGIARSASDVLGTKAMIVETNRVHDGINRRVKYHEVAVKALLDYLDML